MTEPRAAVPDDKPTLALLALVEGFAVFLAVGFVALGFAVLAVVH